ncbi:hypothetical protein TWF730_005403 [Orbilia blumenaviensis]|uniref:Uncharacterized protein n=1 Tax=Orbilia blumenaviensis TaxID=1796055 RepID=A0AAV9VKN5_9PEZI
MPISWSSDNYVKLLAALIAAHPELKLDYHKIAVYFGDGATYDAIQSCMRRVKSKAEELRKEVETGVRPNITPKPTPRKRNSSGQGKGRKGFVEEDVDDEEILTSAKKKAKLIEEDSPTPVKKEGGIKTEGNGKFQNKLGGNAMGSNFEFINISDSEDGDVGNSNSCAKAVVVKAETVANKVVYDYDSEDDYRE